MLRYMVLYIKRELDSLSLSLQHTTIKVTKQRQLIYWSYNEWSSILAPPTASSSTHSIKFKVMVAYFCPDVTLLNCVRTYFDWLEIDGVNEEKGHPWSIIFQCLKSYINIYSTKLKRKLKCLSLENKIIDWFM